MTEVLATLHDWQISPLTKINQHFSNLSKNKLQMQLCKLSIQCPKMYNYDV